MVKPIKTILKVEAPAELYETKIEALKIALDRQEDVQFTFNGTDYIIYIAQIDSLVLKRVADENYEHEN